MKKIKMLTIALTGGLMIHAAPLHQAKADSLPTPADAARADIGEAYTVGQNDCSGFTKRIFAAFGVDLPHNSAAQASYGTAVSRADLQPGDLVFFNTSGQGISHVGIYIGNNQMISAENTNVGVRETQIFDGGASSYWQPRFVTARRIAFDGQSSNTSTADQKVYASANKPAASTQSVDTAVSSASTATAAPQTPSTTESTAPSQSAAVVTQKETAVQPAATVQASGTARPYIVQAGDSLWAIARNHSGLTVAKIQTLNHLKGTIIYPGQKLILKTPIETYTIKAGDTLWKIAKDHSTTVHQLMTDNHLTSDLVFPNRVLALPQQ